MTRPWGPGRGVAAVCVGSTHRHPKPDSNVRGPRELQAMTVTPLCSTKPRKTLHVGALVVVVLASAAAGKDPEPRTYRLTSPPLDIYDRLQELQLGEVPRLGADERMLLAKVWDLRAQKAVGADDRNDPDLLLDAMLFASGIDAADAREDYRQQFHALATTAVDAARTARSPRERGEKLMQLLHAGVMHKGYEDEQTSLAAIFDTGQYNCVSSSALYYFAGTRVGLDLQPVCIPGSPFVPGHASLDLRDGDVRIQVEPTNPDGFDWQSKVKRPGVTVIGFVPKRDAAHDVDGLGLAAMIYSNRGVACSKAQPPQRWAAMRCYLSALTLDPLDESATGNLLAAFANWGPELAAEGKFEAALRVLSFGLSLAPDTEALQRNHAHAWAAYIEATLEAGDDERTLALVRRAAQTTKDRDFDAASAWFIRHGEQRHKDDWEAALAVAERGLKVLPEADRPALLKWRSGVFRRRSQWLLEAEQGPDVAGSMQVLARAYALDAGDESIIAGIAYHTQEALPLVERRSSVKAMSEHFAALRREFPKVKEIGEMGRAHAQRAVLKLAEEKKFAAAVAAVALYEPLCTRPDDRDELGGLAYDRWAQDLAGRQEWQAALGKCAEGLQAFPMQTTAMKRIRITVDDWAKPAIGAKEWDEAIRIYDIGLEYARDDAHLKRNREYCEKMQQKGK